MSRMITYSGRKFNPEKPTRAMINVTDIAHGLSMQARFCGQLREFYSVAEHSVMVSTILEKMGYENLTVHGLFHDAHEAYMSDIPSPIKAFLKPAVVEVEEKIDRAIWSKLQIKAPTVEEKKIIKTADTIAFLIEDKTLRGGQVELTHYDPMEVFFLEKHPDIIAVPAGIRDAKIKFMERFLDLTS